MSRCLRGAVLGGLHRHWRPALRRAERRHEQLGQIGGILSPIVLAYIVDIFANWAIPLYVMAGLYFMSALGWLFIRADRPIEEAAASA